MSGRVIVALAVLLVSACGSPVAGLAEPQPTPTNKAGLPSITFDPCKEIPADVIRAEGLDRKAPKPNRISDGKIETNTCMYTPRDGVYRIDAEASNYTLEMDKADTDHGDFQDFDVKGRKALSYLNVKGQPNACAIDVAATTGVYGVLVSSADGNFAPFADCLSTAKKHLDAFLPYFPN